MKKFLARGSNKGDAKRKSDPPEDGAEEKDDDVFPQTIGCLMIFGWMEAYAPKHQQKITCREVYAPEPATPAFLQWSELSITFDRSDHLDSVPHSGQYPLVIDPIISPKRLSKVLMDGGSGLNIIYVETLNTMGVSRARVWPSRVLFHGIVPGKQAKPSGRSI
jgi:hypothetical protein